MLRGICAAVFAVLVVVFWPAVAHANDVITDGDELRIDLTKARACFIVPTELRSVEACEGFTPDAVRGPTELEGARLLARGLVHLTNDAVGFVMLFRHDSKASSVHLGTAEGYATAYGKGAAKKLSKTATSKMTNAFVVPGPGGPESGGFLRGSVEISDPNPPPIMRFFEHHELAAVYTKSAAYVLVVMGPNSATKAMIELVEDAMVSTRVAHPIPAYEGKDVSEDVGRFVGYALVLALGLGAAAYSHRKSQRAAVAEWQARQPHGQYPASSPTADGRTSSHRPRG